jgi:hypothetical protein
MNFWTGLYKPEFQEQLVAGINVILTTTYIVLANQRRIKPRMLQIEEAGAEDNDEYEARMLRRWNHEHRGGIVEAMQCLLMT